MSPYRQVSARDRRIVHGFLLIACVMAVSLILAVIGWLVC